LHKLPSRTLAFIGALSAGCCRSRQDEWSLVRQMSNVAQVGPRRPLIDSMTFGRVDGGARRKFRSLSTQRWDRGTCWASGVHGRYCPSEV